MDKTKVCRQVHIILTCPMSTLHALLCGHFPARESGLRTFLTFSHVWVQNKAARSVAKLGTFTPTKTLLKARGWMSVRQLMAYHSIMLVHKTMVNRTPIYLYKKLTASGPFQYNTRQAATCPPGFSFTVSHPCSNGTLRQGSGSKLDISKQGWCWRAAEQYNTLPDGLRLERELPNFKKRLKEWIEMNLP